VTLALENSVLTAFAIAVSIDPSGRVALDAMALASTSTLIPTSQAAEKPGGSGDGDGGGGAKVGKVAVGVDAVTAPLLAGRAAPMSVPAL
jgi:hypothetical protein